jgi:hypothetical protein
MTTFYDVANMTGYDVEVLTALGLGIFDVVLAMYTFGVNPADIIGGGLAADVAQEAIQNAPPEAYMREYENNVRLELVDDSYIHGTPPNSPSKELIARTVADTGVQVSPGEMVFFKDAEVQTRIQVPDLDLSKLNPQRSAYARLGTERIFSPLEKVDLTSRSSGSARGWSTVRLEKEISKHDDNMKSLIQNMHGLVEL